MITRGVRPADGCDHRLGAPLSDIHRLRMVPVNVVNGSRGVKVIRKINSILNELIENMPFKTFAEQTMTKVSKISSVVKIAVNLRLEA